MSDEVVHEPIISDELFEAARRKRQETTTTGNPRVGRYAKHLLSGILKCPMCGSSMYADIVQWKNKDGKVMRKIKYQCGHYAKSKFGQCQKNTIPAEWIEAEVIEYTKLLVRNKQFAEDIQGQLGHKTDVSEIDKELDNYHKMIKKLEKSKSNLESDIDAIYDDDKYAERKRQDMNNRLNKIYEEKEDVAEQWEKGYDLPIDEPERKEAEDECKMILELISDIYTQADKGEAVNTVLDDKTIYKMQDRIKEKGYPVITMKAYAAS